MTDKNVEAFSILPTTCLSDALGGRTSMNYSIKALTSLNVTGRAYTVKISKGQNKEFLRAIKNASSDDVIVVDAEGDTNKAIAGDFVLGMAKTLGIRGVVVDGVIRDIVGAQKLNFPVFALGTTSNAGLKSEDGLLNVPISCGGVVVHNGDIIVGDRDGVVVVPQKMEDEVLIKAKEKLKKDEEREKKVANNVEEIYQYINSVIN